MFLYFYETHQNIQDKISDNNFVFKMYIKNQNKWSKPTL